ncbi:MAG TPA: VOC family protein [Gaiellaceae bacterium]|nr:VOC family protein [Gaiellaceae bacterium]
MMVANARPEAAIPVSDPNAALSYYVDTVGLQLLERWDLPQRPMARLSAGNGTLALYESVGAGESRHTLMGFAVDDIETAVEDLRGRGVTFEEYDMGELKTENGIARVAGIGGAWFKDPDGNIVGVVEYGTST